MIPGACERFWSTPSGVLDCERTRDEVGRRNTGMGGRLCCWDFRFPQMGVGDCDTVNSQLSQQQRFTGGKLDRDSPETAVSSSAGGPGLRGRSLSATSGMDSSRRDPLRKRARDCRDASVSSTLRLETPPSRMSPMDQSHSAVMADCPPPRGRAYCPEMTV